MTTYGVYLHAFWKVTDHATGDGFAEPTGRGYVVREVTGAVPYGRMTPVRVYKSKAAANKLADRLTFGVDQPTTTPGSLEIQSSP